MSFVEINVVGMNTTIRLGLVAAGLVASMASCWKGQLILILVAFSSTVSWLTTPEAQSIIGVGTGAWGGGAGSLGCLGGGGGRRDAA